MVKFSFQGHPAELKHGSVVIAAITSCTNTSNPSVMLGAGLVAKKACELGLEVSLKSQQHLNVTFSRKVGCKLSPLKELNVLTVILIILIWCFHVLLYQVKPWIKTSLAPGSRVVTKYLIQRFAIYTYSFVISCTYISIKNIPCYFFSGLQKYLNQQGFHTVGYGCTTCIGNSGELDDSVASAISENGTQWNP